MGLMVLDSYWKRRPECYDTGNGAMSQQSQKRNPTSISKAVKRKRLLLDVWGESIYGIRHKDLARLCGVTPAALSMIFHGLRSPSVPTACRLAPLIGMSVTELYRKNEMAQQMMAEAADPLRRFPLPEPEPCLGPKRRGRKPV